MNTSPLRSLLLITFLAAALRAASAEDPGPGAVPLDEFAQKLASIDDEIAAKIAEARGVVEDEATAKRITEPMAQSLRWTLRAVGKGPANEVRSLIGTLRVPADNPALTGIVKELEGSLSALHARRGTLVATTTQEVKRRVAEMIRTASTVADVDALLASLEKVRTAMQAATSAYESQSTFTNAIGTLRSLRKFIESEASHDSAMLAAAITPFRNLSNYDPEGGAREEISARIERALAPFVAAAEQAQKALDAAIETRQPQIELAALLEAYETAAADADRVRGGYNPNETRSIFTVYRAVVGVIGAVQTGTEQALEKLREVRGTVQQLGGKRAAVFQALFAKWEREMLEAETKMMQQQQEKIRAGLATAKTASDLEPLAADAAALARRRTSRNDGEQAGWDYLARRLNLLAAAWTSVSPILLRQQDRDGNTAGNLFPKELGELSMRIERDVLSRALRAPELNAPPLVEKPIDEAIDTFCDGLAQRGEWRRLYNAVEVRTAMRGEDPRRGNELLQVLRSFLAAQNFELAEQWADAAQAYRMVLSSAVERAPVAAAAERLKAIAKEHPDALKGAPVSPVRPFPTLER